jgi:hypothetical protein
MNDKVLLDVDIDGSCIYDISPLSSPEYQEIKKSPRSLITSILVKSKWFENNEYNNDPENYYYICSLCGDYVYYYQREAHREYHNKNKCCVIQ